MKSFPLERIAPSSGTPPSPLRHTIIWNKDTHKIDLKINLWYGIQGLKKALLTFNHNEAVEGGEIIPSPIFH